MNSQAVTLKVTYVEVEETNSVLKQRVVTKVGVSKSVTQKKAPIFPASSKGVGSNGTSIFKDLVASLVLKVEAKS